MGFFDEVKPWDVMSQLIFVAKDCQRKFCY